MSARRIEGFTLLEIVIAFAILGISLAALYGAFESALLRTRRDTHFSEGTMIAQSLLSRAGSEFPSLARSVRGEWNSYSYELRQEIVSQPSSQPIFTQPLVQVTARVWWTGSAGSRDVEISTLKLASKVD